MYKIRLLADTANDVYFGNGMSISERLQNGGKMILVLMAFVFSVIFVIFLSQYIISKIICGTQKKTESDKNAVTPTETVVAQNEAVNLPQTSVNENDDVTIAVITAALSAYLASTSEDGTVLPFRVVSFKRKNSGKPWNS